MAKTAKRAGAIHAVVGSDEAEVRRAAKELAAELTPAGAGEFGCDTIDGAAENADQATTRIQQTIEALLTLPFFGGSKLVWLRSANFLADNLLGRAAGVLESLEKLEQTLAAGVPEGVTFLLSAFNVDKRRSFYKSLAKLSDVRVFDKVDSTRAGWEEEATRVIEERAGAHGLRFAPDALELLALLTGGDTRQVENEMEKVDIYLGTARRDVTVDDVRMLVPLSRAGVIFELGNALARRDPRRCLSLIDQLLEQGESAIGILLVAIVPTVRNLLLVKDLSTRYRLPPPRQAFHFKATLNRLSETALEHLPRKKDGTINTYPLGIAAMHAGAYELDELKRLLDQCLQANVRLVTSQLEPRIILGELVARLADKN